MIINVGSGAAGYTLTVGTSAGVTVSIAKDGNTYTKQTDSNGSAYFNNLASGTWTVTLTKGGITKTETVEITEDTSIAITLNSIPEFNYTGTCKVVNDADTEISESTGNWKIRFLTSGTLTFTRLNGAAAGIDVFCVGGGGDNSYGGGGGGGYTQTGRNIAVEVDKGYYISVGGRTGTSSAFNVSASGASRISTNDGGNGGSGGGGKAGNGGTNGGNGQSIADYDGGTGQGRTTREFGESGAKNLYSSGGAGDYTDSYWPSNGAGLRGANTGAGGNSRGDQNENGCLGYSGIVIIRNKR